jgi:hypothetical protein
MSVRELVFVVTLEVEGGFVAEAVGKQIVTQGESWSELRSNVLEAVSAFFFDRPKPERIRMNLSREEVLAVG